MSRMHNSISEFVHFFTLLVSQPFVYFKSVKVETSQRKLCGNLPKNYSLYHVHCLFTPIILRGSTYVKSETSSILFCVFTKFCRSSDTSFFFFKLLHHHFTFYSKFMTIFWTSLNTTKNDWKNMFQSRSIWNIWSKELYYMKAK